MSRLFKSLLLIPSGGAAKLEYRESINIFSAYNLCSSIPFEELTVTLASIAVISIAEVRLVASPPTAGITFNHVQNPQLTSSPASAYSLATAPT